MNKQIVWFVSRTMQKTKQKKGNKSVSDDLNKMARVGLLEEAMFEKRLAGRKSRSRRASLEDIGRSQVFL